MMLNLLFMLINNLYLVICFFFFAAFFPYRKRWKNHVVAAVLLLYVGCLCFSLLRFINTPQAYRPAYMGLLAALQLVYQFAVIRWVFEGGVLYQCVLFLCSKGLDVLSSIIMAAVYARCFPEMYNRMLAVDWQFPLEVIVYFVMPLPVILLLYYAAFLFLRFVRGREHPKLQHLLVLMIPATQILLVVILLKSTLFAFSPTTPARLYAGGALMLVCCCSDFALYHILLRAREASELKSRLQMSEMQQQYYALLETQQSQVRRLQHDMKNHLNTLQGMAGQDADAQKAYLARLTEELPTLKLYYCPSPAVNALLVNKAAQGESLGIDFTCHIALTTPDEVDAFDLVTLLSNIIDNAFEAVRQNESTQRRVRLQLLQAKNAITIVCENTLPAEPDEEKSYLDAEKQSHGNGMKIIEKTAKKYNCRPTVTQQDGEYRIAMVLLPPV